jgi:hypothetical protein
VEEPAFLISVQRIVGGVQIEDDLLGRGAVGIKEQIDKQSLDGRRVSRQPRIACRLGAAQLQPVQGALAGQRRAIAAPGRQLAGERGQHRVMAQLVMVDQVLVSQRNANHALHHQRFDRVLHQGRIAVVREAGRQSPGQSDHPVRRPQQQRPGIRGDPPAVKRGDHRAPFHACKLEQARVTLCRHRGTPPLSAKALLQKNFRRFGAPMHLSPVRNAG